MADTRKQDTDFNYWLNVIEQLSGNSPLIVILNERHGHRFKIDEPGLKGRFGKFYKETYEVNFADRNHQRLQKLRQGIKHYLANLSHIGDILPASWVAIRKDLADLLDQKKLRYIPQSRFIEICKKHGIDELSKMLNLSGYFHTIGVFIHYQNDKVLKNTIFLDANWTTKTVYQLLNDNNVKKNNGRFRKRDAKRIWKTDENLMLIDELLQLLERFSIAYHIENTENYIVPEHLPDKQPL